MNFAAFRRATKFVNTRTSPSNIHRFETLPSIMHSPFGTASLRTALNEAGAGVNGLEQPPFADRSQPDRAGSTTKRPLKLPGFRFVRARYGARHQAAAAPLVQDSAQVKALREEIWAGVHAAAVEGTDEATATSGEPEETVEERRVRFKIKKAILHNFYQRMRKTTQVRQYKALSHNLNSMRGRSGMHLAQLYVVLSALSMRGVKLQIGWQRLVSEDCCLVLPAAAVSVLGPHYVEVIGAQCFAADGRLQLLQSGAVGTAATTGSGELSGVQLMFSVQTELTTLR
eukprot:10884-Heterococcus_DN1.PRE.1